ncbi:hypothetical protein ACS0TY_012930 [Phlomoides rotata]
MSSITRLILIISLSLLSFTPPFTANPLTVYEALQSYDFSVGLIPKGVTSNELDPSTGKFIVKLNGTCSFDIDGYALKYKSTISGTISKDKIKDLKGIQVKVLFFLVNIVEVTRDKDVTLLCVTKDELISPSELRRRVSLWIAFTRARNVVVDLTVNFERALTGGWARCCNRGRSGGVTSGGSQSHLVVFGTAGIELGQRDGTGERKQGVGDVESRLSVLIQNSNRDDSL